MNRFSRRDFKASRRFEPTLRRARALAVGVLGGFAFGFGLWSREQVARSRDLFHARPLRRLAALGYLSGHPSDETVRLLREYVRWEKRRDLRGRAVRLLHRIERHLV